MILISTTGGFSSQFLLEQEDSLTLDHFDREDAIEIGQIASRFAIDRRLSVVIEVRIDGWVAYRACHEGTSPVNDSWLDRKNRVVELKHHSTMFERVRSEELGLNWNLENGLSEELYAIHGGGFPIVDRGVGLVGVLLISGLPQVEDHELAVETLSAFKEG